LWTHQSTVAIAAGVNVMLDPAFNIFYSKAGLSAADGRCKTFSGAADGIGRAEGAGVIVLKTLRDALANGDRVYAVIRGGAVNHDGRSNGLTQPNRWAQEQLLRTAFAHAGIASADMDYVELHGTGTLIGDPIEANALGTVLADQRERRCLVGSVKTNIGHAEAAAGIAGLIKLALSLHHGKIPPSLWFDTPNPHIDFDRLPLRVAAELTAWEARNGVRVGGISSFGIGGTNAHLVLQSCADERTYTAPRATDLHWLLISARSASALKAQVMAYDQLLESGCEADLPRICSAALGRKGIHDFRVSLLGQNIAELRAAAADYLASRQNSSHWSGRYRPEQRRIAVALADENLISTHMLAAQISRSAEAQRAWNECRAALDAAGITDLPDAASMRSAKDVRDSDANFAAWKFAAHSALLTLLSDACSVDLILATGVGQLAALCHAGAVSLADASRCLAAGFSPESIASMQAGDYRISCQVSRGRNLRPADIDWTAGAEAMEKLIERANDTATDVVYLHLNSSGAALRAAHGQLTLTTYSESATRMFARLALGHLLKWQALAASKDFVALPAYPWQRQSFWLLPRLSNHPLLSERLSPSAWRVDLRRKGLQFLEGHRVQGSIVLPAAAYCELGLAVLEALKESGRGQLRDVQFLIPHVDHGAGQDAASLNVRYDETTREFSVLTTRTQGDPVCHARGSFTDAALVQSASLCVTALRERCTLEVNTADLYARLRSRGLEYTGEFQAIRSVWKGAGEVLARIEQPARQFVAAGFAANPALLDASFQTLAALLDSREDTNLYIPTSIARLSLHENLPAAFWCHARLIAQPGGNLTRDTLQAELTLLDESGRVLMEVRGFTARALALPRAADEPFDQWLYRYRWQAQEVPSATAAPAKWLVFADQPAPDGHSVADELCAVLSPISEAVVRVNRGDPRIACDSDADILGLIESVRDDSPRRAVFLHTLDATQPAAWQPVLNVLKAIADGRLPTLEDIVVVTRGAYSLEGDGNSRAVFPGLVRVAQAELPQIRLRLIDIDAQPGAALLKEIVAQSDEREVALHAGERRVLRLARGADAVADGGSEGAPIRDDGTYLITGGYGGFGLEVASWLVQRGARSLALVGRNGPDAHASKVIENMERGGVQVLKFKADIAIEQDVRGLFESLGRQAMPLKGIFHAAAVLKDGEIAALQSSVAEDVLQPKAHGAWLLHRHSGHLPLEHFVLFSSIAAMLGNRHQAAYAMAGTSLDSLAQARRKAGLPAISISWGPLTGVGMLARNPALAALLASRGAESFAPDEAIRMLERIVRWNPIAIGAARLNWQRMTAVDEHIAHASLFRDCVGNFPEAARSEIPSATVTLDEAGVEGVLRAILAETLQIGEDEIDRDASLFSLGVDSLMALDLQVAAEQRLGVRIAAMELLKGGTLAHLSAHVVMLRAHTPAQAAPVSIQEVAQDQPNESPIDTSALLRQLDVMSEDEMDGLLEKLMQEQQVEQEARL
jgi:acyl transferase domain-containing protein/acyl carrier protein